MNTVIINRNAPSFTAQTVTGETVSIPSQGFTLLTFFRFATCPFCTLRLKQLRVWAETHGDVQVIGIFGSPTKEVLKAKDIHHVSIPLVADSAGEWYRSYGIRKSVWGMLFGMIRRFPQLIMAMMQGLFPKNPHGHLTTMPAEFLIDSSGVVKLVHYGKDEGDHLPFSEIELALNK